MKYNIIFYCKLVWLYIAHCTLQKLCELYLITATVTISQWYKYLCSMLQYTRSSEVTSHLGMTLDVRDDAAKSAKVLAMLDEIERVCHLLQRKTDIKNTLRHTLPQVFIVNHQCQCQRRFIAHKRETSNALYALIYEANKRFQMSCNCRAPPNKWGLHMTPMTV